jgi:hypothetical protein
MVLFQQLLEENEQNQERHSVRIYGKLVCIRTNLLHNKGLDQSFPVKGYAEPYVPTQNR